MGTEPEDYDIYLILCTSRFLKKDKQQ